MLSLKKILEISAAWHSYLCPHQVLGAASAWLVLKRWDWKHLEKTTVKVLASFVPVL